MFKTTSAKLSNKKWSHHLRDLGAPQLNFSSKEGWEPDFFFRAGYLKKFLGLRS